MRSALRRFGRGSALALRFLMALLFISAAANKWLAAWICSDKLLRVFTERLGEIDPESFGARFIEGWGIPHFRWFAVVVTLGETAIALGLLAGFMTRGAALGAMLMMFCFAMGGYYDASLIALGLMFLPLILLPTGHTFGLDRRLHVRYPASRLFR